MDWFICLIDTEVTLVIYQYDSMLFRNNEVLRIPIKKIIEKCKPFSDLLEK